MNFEDTMVENRDKRAKDGQNRESSGSDPTLQDFQTYEDTSLSTHLQNLGNADDQDLDEAADDYQSNIFQINQLDLNRMQHFGCKQLDMTKLMREDYVPLPRSETRTNQRFRRQHK